MRHRRGKAPTATDKKASAAAAEEERWRRIGGGRKRSGSFRLPFLKGRKYIAAAGNDTFKRRRKKDVGLKDKTKLPPPPLGIHASP